MSSDFAGPRMRGMPSPHISGTRISYDMPWFAAFLVQNPRVSHRFAPSHHVFCMCSRISKGLEHMCTSSESALGLEAELLHRKDSVAILSNSWA